MKPTTTEEATNVKSYLFKVVIEEDSSPDGGRAYHASCPALKGRHTWGHTYREALANIREAVELYVDDLREAGEPVPLDPDGACSATHGLAMVSV
ncbi:MAG: type II toxin-antitoxin system HicB family antitoxin [bacterium]|nr:type II toxin-antitoxin system HicB family antitoxin [bacterium]